MVGKPNMGIKMTSDERIQELPGPAREMDYGLSPLMTHRLANELWDPIAGAGRNSFISALHLSVVGGTCDPEEGPVKRRQNNLPTSRNRKRPLLFRRGNGSGQWAIAPV